MLPWSTGISSRFPERSAMVVRRAHVLCALPYPAVTQFPSLVFLDPPKKLSPIRLHSVLRPHLLEVPTISQSRLAHGRLSFVMPSFGLPRRPSIPTSSILRRFLATQQAAA